MSGKKVIQKILRTGSMKIEKNEQTTRIVKYLIAWRDYKNINMASIELTILAVKHHVKDDDDAISLQKTVDAIYSELNFFRYIKKPVARNQ